MSPDLPQLEGCLKFGVNPWRASLNLANLYISEPHGKAVILQQDVSACALAVVWKCVVLAFRENRLELWRIAVVLQHLHAVQPVLTMLAVHHNAGGIPIANGPDRLIRCGGDHVIKRCNRAI